MTKKAIPRRAVIALGKIARRYPIGTASLFEGAGIESNVTGESLAHALRSGRVTAGQLYDHTYGRAVSSWSEFNPLNNVKALEIVGGPMDKQAQQNQATKGKFENIVNTLLGSANQAAEIYTKFKTAGQPAVAVDPAAGSGPVAKKMPWGIIAGAAALVVILVVVLLMLRKK